MFGLVALISVICVLMNMEYLRNRYLVLVCFGISFVGGFFNSLMFSGIKGLNLSLRDVFFTGLLYGVIILAGVILATKSKLPTFFSGKCKALTQVFYGIGFGVVIGVFLYIINNIAFAQYYSNVPEGARNFVNYLGNVRSPFLSSLYISLQAGITEESIYRLLFIPAIYTFLSQEDFRIKHKKKLVVAIIISSIAFGLIGTHSFVFASIMGVIMSILYLRYGFVSVVLTHFVADIFSMYSIITLIKLN